MGYSWESCRTSHRQIRDTLNITRAKIQSLLTTVIYLNKLTSHHFICVVQEKERYLKDSISQQFTYMHDIRPLKILTYAEREIHFIDSEGKK